jgi:hypothetical protein
VESPGYDFDGIFWSIFDQKLGQLKKNYFSKTKNNTPPKFYPLIYNILMRFPAKLKENRR